jgi:hypothetical protein
MVAGSAETGREAQRHREAKTERRKHRETQREGTAVTGRVVHRWEEKHIDG